jgi:uncharacterized protein
MKWDPNQQSNNVEDRRSSSGGGGGFRVGGGRGIGLGTIVIALVAGWIFGINPMTVLGILGGGGGDMSAPQVQQAPAQRPPKDDQMAAFVSYVLADSEQVWGAIFQQSGKDYPEPRLVLFRGATPTACGSGESAMGPFYCPADQKVYIDLSFYETMKSKLGAPGDFAQAYVIAHEVGHHVQHVLGITGRVQQMRARLSERENNAMSVRVELQADCFAGVWAHHAQQARQILEKGDIEEAMNAAAAIGDDALQKKSQGYAVPDSFTHGTSQQRMRWFNQGLQSGSVKQCDTFSTKQL